MPDDLFADLPVEGEVVEKTEEQKKREEEEIRKLSIANKQEDRKLDQLKKDLAEKRRIRKELGGLDTDIDPLENVPLAPKDPTVDVESVIEKTLKKRDEDARKTRIAALIKRSARTRQEAETAYAQLDKFESTGSDELDAKFAFDRASGIRDSGMVINPSLGGGGVDFSGLDKQPAQDFLPGVSKESRAWLNEVGITDEDIRVIKSGGGFSRAFPKQINSSLKRVK